MCCRCATFDGMKKREHCDTRDTFWFKRPLNDRIFLAWKWSTFHFCLWTVSLDFYGMRLPIRSHLFSSKTNSLFIRYRSPHVRNCSIQAFHLHRDMRPIVLFINVRRRFAGAVYVDFSAIDVQGSTYFNSNTAERDGGKLVIRRIHLCRGSCCG